METQNAFIFESAEAWEEWLAANHTACSEIWLKLAKKGVGISSVNYAQALDVALCYGWIDGLKKPCDAQYWLQRFTPRRSKSGWSKVNREHIMRLVEAGRMQTSGTRQVDAAKADGRWASAYDAPSMSTVPDDFQQALHRSPQAQQFFDTLNKANRYAILYRIQTAQKAETRERRMSQLIALLERGEKLHP